MRTTLFTLIVLLSQPLFAADTPSVFVDKDTKLGKILQWFQKGEAPSLTEVESLAKKEVDLVEQLKKAGYEVPADADKWNKLAVLSGKCSAQDKPDLLDRGDLYLKNRTAADEKQHTYLFPTWDKDADSSALLHNALERIPDLGDYGIALGIKFKKYQDNDSLAYRSTPIEKDTSVLVDAITFSTKYSQTGAYNHREHVTNYELRKVVTETVTYYALKEILASSNYSEEQGMVGKTTRACLFEVKN